MSPADREALERQYEEAAQAYLCRSSAEPLWETTAQATQRKITLESLDLVSARRPEVQVFNDLLIRYNVPRGSSREVVPDNTVIVCEKSIDALHELDLSVQPVGPLCVLDYPSGRIPPKDYDDNRERYERELKVPYYLLFYPDDQELTLFRHNRRKYLTVRPNAEGRVAIPELELEAALLDGWVRYWFRGELLPLSPDLQRRVDELVAELNEERRRHAWTRGELDQERRARLAAEEELARLRARLGEWEGGG